MATIDLATINLCPGGTGANIEPQVDVEFTENNTYSVYPSTGYDAVEKVNVTVNIPEEIKTVDITANGTYNVLPTNGLLKSVTVNARISEPTPSIDMSLGFKFRNSTFTTIPYILINKVPSANNLFANCENLIKAPYVDLTNCWDGNAMFAGTSKLEEVPDDYDVSYIQDYRNMFSSSGLKNFPAWKDFSGIQHFDAFGIYSKAVTVPEYDLGNLANDCDLMFYRCYDLTTLGGFKNLKVNVSFNTNNLLTHESLVNVINDLGDVTASPKTLTLGETNLAKLTEDEKAIAINKGWILA